MGNYVNSISLLEATFEKLFRTVTEAGRRNVEHNGEYLMEAILISMSQP